MKVFIIALLLSASVFATDYSSMSIDELSSMRGSVPAEDRDSFRSAWQSKMQGLSVEERQAYSRGKGQKGKGNGGQGMQQKGRGQGMGYNR
jgi:hypothetical protein